MSEHPENDIKLRDNSSPKQKSNDEIEEALTVSAARPSVEEALVVSPSMDFEVPVETSVSEPKPYGGESTPEEKIASPQSTEPREQVLSSAKEPEALGSNLSIQLENAMVGRNYHSEVDLGTVVGSSFELPEDFVKEFAQLGLHVRLKRDSGDKLEIEGNPLSGSAGEHKILYATNDPGPIPNLVNLRLLINADPKSLWKQVEPPEDLPYRKDHIATSQLEGNGYKIIAASRRGRSHAHEGTFRDDDFAITILDSGWDILIVADGAGSAKFSRRGSLLACSEASKFLEEKIAESSGNGFEELLTQSKSDAGDKELKNLLYQILCGAAFAAHKRIQKEADETGAVLKDFATTFLCSIVRPVPDGLFIASFGIGDGAVGVYEGNSNAIELMNIPDGGDFSGQTRFLTMRELVSDGSEMLRRVKYSTFESVTALFMMTDGISDPKFGTDKSLLDPEKWQALGEDILKVVDFSRQNENAATQLCEWMDFWAQGEHDDRTLVIRY